MRHSILTTLFLLFAFGAMAQPPRERGEGGMRGEGVHVMQCNQIIKVLQIDDAKQEAFREIFMSYNRALKEIRSPQNRELPPAIAEQPPTEEQIEERIITSFDHSIKSMELKKEYYKKFRTILSPSQISRMYNIERNIRDRAIEEMSHRNHNRGERGDNIPKPPY